MRASDFDYPLPSELIAQEPAQRRDQSRLLVVERASSALAHRAFPDLLDYLRPGDLVVLNNSRVIPARLRARNPLTGGRFELLLLEEVGENRWWAMLRPGKRARVGSRIEILDKPGEASGLSAVVREVNEEGHRLLEFSRPVLGELERLGEVPLPPYILRPVEEAADRERYQTVYASLPGSVAAPTAGLHFTDDLLRRAREKGVEIHYVTLHVGVGTFAPVKTERIAQHVMHEERFDIPAETAAALRGAKAAGRRVVAVGTTSVRVLETWARTGAERGRTSIFIYPPFEFQVVDLLLTNFHLPRSTLLMLVAAFAAPGAETGRELALRAYREAIERRYRFFSYGDAMLVV